MIEALYRGSFETLVDLSCHETSIPIITAIAISLSYEEVESKEARDHLNASAISGPAPLLLYQDRGPFDK